MNRRSGRRASAVRLIGHAEARREYLAKKSELDELRGRASMLLRERRSLFEGHRNVLSAKVDFVRKAGGFVSPLKIEIVVIVSKDINVRESASAPDSASTIKAMVLDALGTEQFPVRIERGEYRKTSKGGEWISAAGGALGFGTLGGFIPLLGGGLVGLTNSHVVGAAIGTQVRDYNNAAIGTVAASQILFGRAGLGTGAYAVDAASITPADPASCSATTRGSQLSVYYPDGFRAGVGSCLLDPFTPVFKFGAGSNQLLEGSYQFSESSASFFGKKYCNLIEADAALPGGSVVAPGDSGSLLLLRIKLLASQKAALLAIGLVFGEYAPAAPGRSDSVLACHMLDVLDALTISPDPSVLLTCSQWVSLP